VFSEPISGAGNAVGADETLARLRGRVRACYMNARKANPSDPGGDTKCRLTVSPTGDVKDATCTAPSEVVRDCIAGAIRQAKFKAPESGQDVSFSATFHEPAK
jgi:hypothetical protein